jgi:positive regulator of sigma E activity
MLNEKKEFYFLNVGILMYLFGSTVLFLVGNLTASLSLKWSKIPWILNAFLYVMYQILILIEWKKSFYKKEIQ